MTQVPEKLTLSGMHVENVSIDESRLPISPDGEANSQNKSEAIQASSLKPVPSSSCYKTDSQQVNNSEPVSVRRYSCPASKRHDSALANNIELFLKKRRELLCLTDNSVTKSNCDSFNRSKSFQNTSLWWQAHSSDTEGKKNGPRSAVKGPASDNSFMCNKEGWPNREHHNPSMNRDHYDDSTPSHACIAERTGNSPARFLECCLAAERGDKDLFGCNGFKDGSYGASNVPKTRNLEENFYSSEVHKGGASPNVGSDMGCSEANKGASPHMCKGSCSTCCNIKWDVEAALKNKKAQKNTCGDAKTSDSGIHNEVDCCRICQEDGTYEKLISPCYCSGTVGYMHMSCLETWLGLNGRTACELCLFPFPVVKIRPNIWQFFSRPLANMDFASLLCDIACFCVLTPLLIASTYLCSIGVSHYEEVGKTGSVFAIVTLMVSLIAVYISWAVLAILYHRRVFLTWREKAARIQMWTDKISPNQSPNKMPDEIKGNVEGPNSGNTPLTNRSLSGASLFLKPMLWYSYRLRSQRSGSGMPFGNGVNFNSNRTGGERVMPNGIDQKRFEDSYNMEAKQLPKKEEPCMSHPASMV